MPASASSASTSSSISVCSSTVASPEGRIATSVEFLDRVAGLLGLEIVEIEAPDLWHGSRTANESHL